MTSPPPIVEFYTRASSRGFCEIIPGTGRTPTVEEYCALFQNILACAATGCIRMYVCMYVHASTHTQTHTHTYAYMVVYQLQKPLGKKGERERWGTGA